MKIEKDIFDFLRGNSVRVFKRGKSAFEPIQAAIGAGISKKILLEIENDRKAGGTPKFPFVDSPMWI